MATLKTEALEAAHRLGWLANRSHDQLLAAHSSVASAIRLLDFLASRDYLRADSDALVAHLEQHPNTIFTYCRWLESAGYIQSYREELPGDGGKMIYALSEKPAQRKRRAAAQSPSSK
jgi:hypothetical protein